MRSMIFSAVFTQTMYFFRIRRNGRTPYDL